MRKRKVLLVIPHICRIINHLLKVLNSRGCVIGDKENTGWGLSGIVYSEEEDEFVFECRELTE